MASQDWLEKDFYAVLGVEKDVSDKELKKKYHKLAHKYHPDSHPGDAAAEAKFKEISEAFSVLSDPKQREEYDQIRAMRAGGARFTSGGTGGFEDLFGGMFGGQNVRFERGNRGGFEDIFTMFGDGAHGFGDAGAQFTRRRGENITHAVTVDFLTAAHGETVAVETPTGRVKIRIPAGVEDGKKIRVRGKGAAGVGGGAPGDLILVVQVRKHPVFEREGNNLRLRLPLTVTEAMLGATVEVPTLDGEAVKLKVQAGTPSGRVLRVKGRGIASSHGTGDLLAEVQIVVPSRLTDKQRAAIEAYREIEPTENPRTELFAQSRS